MLTSGLLYLGEAGLAGSEGSGPGPTQPCDLEGLTLYFHEPQASFFGSSLGDSFIFPPLIHSPNGHVAPALGQAQL